MAATVRELGGAVRAAGKEPPEQLRQWLRLERQMCALPPIRSALPSGRLTYTKAPLVARGATPEDVEERIEEAASRTS
jgi:hypothetical protein